MKVVHLAASALCLAGLSLAWNVDQSVLSEGRYDSGLFMPMEDLNALLESTFTTLEHPAFPKHSVRIKKTEFCDETVNAYTGYIDVEARHLFFYFFESRSEPEKDDVVFWTNGGPGGSSSLGLFMELGPCRVVSADSTRFHPESWNSKANVFFIDQPVGVGFSYASHGEYVSTTEEAAKDIAAFVHVFFEHFKKFQGNPFHMAGESYGGRYIPIFAAEVYDQNRRLVEEGLQPINLSSIMIGNGKTDFMSMYPAYYEVVCTPVTRDPILDIAACVRMKQAVPRCIEWAQKGCVDTFDMFSCQAAISFCKTEIMGPFEALGLNPYDISGKCEGDEADTLCYPITKDIAHYLDRPDVRKLIGVDPSVTQNFTGVNMTVNAAFIAAMDGYHPTFHYVSNLLDRGIKALIYVGKNDWICNHVGNERWTLDLEWSGGEGFRNSPKREWLVGGKVAGETRSFGGLTFATVIGAGHMVPYDKPAEALQLVNRWFAGEEL
ncbi:hypothetical protein D9611_011383 [Ephemerocybe angulata]|uniref:Carboxypeptidase n=1 Tax=Ephemerocybe angulata TaxID=980116 RepID=A0A8H5BDN0_9AGAR|nr:hypothetical protein D9611_011383 [Tulosesus angulatus]